jgi:hypothetical protein
MLLVNELSMNIAGWRSFIQDELSYWWVGEIHKTPKKANLIKCRIDPERSLLLAALLSLLFALSDAVC